MSSTLKKRTIDRYGQLPIYFIPNEGQLEDRRIRYYAKGAGCDVFFTDEGASFVYREGIPSPLDFKNTRFKGIESSEKGKGLRLDFRFLGNNQSAIPEARGKMTGSVNYFRGKKTGQGHTNISLFQEVVYQEVWPGIDLIFRGEKGRIKYEFVLQPKAMAENIRFTYVGADGLSLDEQGNLLMDTPFGVMKDTYPVSYYQKDEVDHYVESAFQLIRGEEEQTFITFTFGKSYDDRYPLIIDPMIYSTYLGGSDFNQGYDIAVDNDGNAYVTGYTTSNDFPTSPGAYDTTFNGNFDVFVTKVNPTGTALIYSTYLGGAFTDWGWSITVDKAGNAYVTGITSSNNFPTTINAYQPTNPGAIAAFVTKINPTGTALVYSTYLGGSGFLNQGSGIAVDDTGNAYIAGYTTSTDFPFTPGAFQTTSNGNGDAFVTKLNPAGSALVYSTYLGGTNLDQGLGIAVDDTGSAYVTGVTQSADFPTTSSAFQPTFTGFAQAFVTKFNSMGTGLVYSTFLGGSNNNSSAAIALDSTGNAYVTGFTNSADFPTTPDAYRPMYNGDGDAFVTKLNTIGTALVYSTYLGGTDTDQGFGIAVDNAGNAHVTGITQSTDFPTTVCTFDSTFNGGQDAFIAKFNPTGTQLVNSTYLGGSGNDQGWSIAVDNVGNAYVTGMTISTDFPTTSDAFDKTFNGVQDAFVTKINFPPDVPLLLEVSLTKDIQVQSDAMVTIQGNFCEPRTTSRTDQNTADYSLQQKEQIGCIRAKRVHDWVVLCMDHQQKGFIPGDIAQRIQDCRNAGDRVNVHCEIVPGSSNFTVIDDTQHVQGIPDARIVEIRFSLLTRIQYTCNGTPFCSFDVPITTTDRIVLCYPKGTSIVAKISANDCLVVSDDC